MQIELKECTSSNIAAFGYDADSQTLAVKFHSGSIFHYFRVPSEVYEKMKAASSIGSFFFQNIKDLYNARRQK